MKQRIVAAAESYWQARLPALRARVQQAARQVEDILKLEDYNRRARGGTEPLRQSLGTFGSQALNLSALSGVLERGYASRELQKQRLQRVRGLAEELQAAQQSLEADPPACHFMEVGGSAVEVQQVFDAHLASVARILAAVRIAGLEARGRYVAEEHDGFFEQFDWRHLDNEESALCPPFLLFAEPSPRLGDYLAPLLELVTSGYPVKIALLHNHLFLPQPEHGRAAVLQGLPDPALLFLSLRNVFYFQGSVALEDRLQAGLEQGLASARPAIFSLLVPLRVDEAAREYAEQALNSRTFPHLLYDPEAATDFVSCLDLSANPALDQQWVTTTLRHLPPPAEGDNGSSGEGGGEATAQADAEEQTLELVFTTADFAATDPDCAAEFSPLPESTPEEELSPVADYLRQTPLVRRRLTAVAHQLDGQGHLHRRVPSPVLLAQTADRQHLWNALQELGGISNPYVTEAERRLREELTATHEAALAKLREELEGNQAAREREVVAKAMRQLAEGLAGVAGAQVELTQLPAAPAASAAPAPEAEEAPAEAAAPAPAAAPEPPAPSAEAWIDERLCTACDECITINKQMFAYNSKKKAYIKDVHAGPFKDMVRAAEKCSSGAIHPGLPLNPDEKDVDKWVERAAPFQ